MASFSLFLLPFIMTLPAPFKVALIILGGFAFTGFRSVEMKQVEAQQRAVPNRPVPADVAPDLVAPKIAPKAGDKAMVPAKITMDINGEFILNGEKITEAAMLKKLKAMAKANPQQKVTLEADARAPVQLIANAMKLCKSAGISNVTFSAKAPVLPADPANSP